MITRVDESNASGFPSSNLQKYQSSILKKSKFSRETQDSAIFLQAKQQWQ